MTDKQNNCKYFDKETGAKMIETFRWYRKVLGLDKEKDLTVDEYNRAKDNRIL